MHWRTTSIFVLALGLASAFGAAKTPGGHLTFADRVVRSPSVVYLKGFHTATQRGPTCNVYSAWMILRYYKYHINPGQVRKGSYDGSYKTSQFIADKMSSLGFRFLAYIPKQSTDFADVVRTCIDNGIPLQWGVNLKYAPGVRARRNGTTRDAGHARVIWGYERDRRSGEMKKIIFADPWGRGALRQRVDIDEACHMTMSMHPIFPKDTDPALVARLLAIPGMRELKGKPLPDRRPPRPRRKKKRRDE